MKRQLIILNGIGCGLSVPLLLLGIANPSIDARITSGIAASLHIGVSATLATGKMLSGDGQLPELQGYSVAGMPLSLPPSAPETVDAQAESVPQPAIAPPLQPTIQLRVPTPPPPTPPEPEPITAQSEYEFHGFNF